MAQKICHLEKDLNPDDCFAEQTIEIQKTRFASGTCFASRSQRLRVALVHEQDWMTTMFPRLFFVRSEDLCPFLSASVL